VQGTSSTNAVGDSPATANYSAFEQSFNDSQADIGAIPVNSANGAVYESKAGFWRTLLGRGEH